MPRTGVTTYELLIASPSDVVTERDVVAECASDWSAGHRSTGVQVQSVRWELDAVPSLADRGQAVINEQLVDGADILIGIFKARIGSPTGVSASGTIEEIDRFVAAGKPVMLYFSTGPIPHNHDAEQLRLRREYKNLISSRGLYAEFADEADLRRQVNRHLGAMMTRLQQNSAAAPAPQSNLARVHIRTRPGDRSGDVATVRVQAILDNLSSVRNIKEYSCILSVPKACLTHASGLINGELTQNQPPDRRVFRVSNHDAGRPQIIFHGDSLPLFMLDLGVDQLKMQGTWLAGDYDGTMADKVTVDAVIEGEQFHDERNVGDMFRGPVHG